MKHRLLTQLVLPLAAATALTLLIHYLWPADGFFLNVAAGFVGSIVTVGYIDSILQQHEAERWKETDSRIYARLNKLASATITEIRTSFGFSTEIFDQFAFATGDQNKMQKEVIRVAIHVLAPAADAKITALNQKQWASFAAKLQRSSEECGIILDRFSQRLSPETIAILLDLQQHLESAQTYWRIFPDVAGVPAELVPKMNSSPGSFQIAWCELSAKDVRKVLELSTKLSAVTIHN